MYSIIADTHTHSISCDHGFSTVAENAAAASAAGLKAIAMTEHAPALVGSPSFIHFRSLRIIPRYLSGVLMIRGAEVNILDFDGNLDLDDKLLAGLEWVIASYHPPVIDPGSEKDHTNGWMKVANNPHVDVIGHCGAPRYAFEHKPVIQEFARTGKIVEINANSVAERPGSDVNCKAIAVLCAEYDVPVVVNSDAHYCGNIGRVEAALAILEDISFPEKLILNADYERFITALEKVNGGTFLDCDD